MLLLHVAPEALDLSDDSRVLPVDSLDGVVARRAVRQGYFQRERLEQIVPFERGMKGGAAAITAVEYAKLVGHCF